MNGKLTAAVLTGDIIGFSTYSEATRKEILSVLYQVSEEIQARYPDQAFPIGLYRGDGWQLVMLRPFLALRIALQIRCALKIRINQRSMDTRTAIAIGPVDYLPEGTLQTGDGEAFRASGYLLEALPRRTNLGFRWPSGPSLELEEVLDVMLQLLDTIANQWTVKQALAVDGALQGKRQVDIASAWQPDPVSQQAVAQHLDSASWTVVSLALDAFEKTISTRRISTAPPPSTT